MKKPFYKALSVLCIGTLFMFSCNKKEDVKVDNETQSSVDNAVADQEYMSIAPAANSHAINTKGTGSQVRIMSVCDTLSLISGDTLWGYQNHVNPTYTMNISNQACAQTMADGRLRTGYLSIRLTGKIRDAGSMMIIKLLNYKANLISYACDSMVLTTLSSNTLVTSFNVTLNHGVCQSPNWTIKYNLNKTISFYPHGLNGSGDQTTLIYGTASGTNREGRDFSVNIPQATPLVKASLCPYISSGIMQLTPKDYATRTIDFGYSLGGATVGGCDEDASFTVNGSTVAFKLK